MTTTQHVWYYIGNGVLYLATMAILLVIAYYWLITRWWKKPEGRHVMAWNAWACAVLLYLSERALFGPPAKIVDNTALGIRIIVYSTGLCLFIWRGLLIARAQAVSYDAGALLSRALDQEEQQ